MLVDIIYYSKLKLHTWVAHNSNDTFRKIILCKQKADRLQYTKGGFSVSKFKRFVSTMATTAILVSGISTSSFAALSSDIIGTDYEEAAKVLGAFEIMVGDAGTGLFRPGDPIKRSEVTKVAVALKGLAGVANSNSATGFPDVPPGHWATGFINVGTTEGLVIGDDKGNFRPDDNITYSEAITILVRALGYEPQAKAKGGFPNGYLAAGNSTGLTKGISVAMARNANPISRGQVAQLAYNALNINLMEQIGFGNNASFEVVDETLLTSKLNAKLVQGTVTAVGGSALEGEGVEKGEIMIGDKIYKTGNADVRNVLGIYVDAYVVDKSSSKENNTVKAIVPSAGKNSITTILADDIDSVTGTSSKVINYYRGNKKDKITIPEASLVVYNGKATNIDALTTIDSGAIMVVDYEKDKKIVFVNETENYVVDEVVTSSNRVIDKYGKSPLTLDADDESVTFVIDKGNEIIDIADLKEWDVLTLTISKDKSIVYGSVINNKVEGTITEKDNEHIYVNGEKLKVAANYTKELSLGDEGVFYLDAEGKIAAFDEGAQVSKNYAYLSDLAVKSGLDSKLEIEIFTHEGKVVTMEAANRIKVDGKSYSTPQTALDAIGAKGQLITFEVNSDGKINEIDKSLASEDIDEKDFVLNFSEEGVSYNAKTGKLNAKTMGVRVDENTVVFDIPKDSEDADDYSISDKSFFSDGGKYDITVYDVTEELTAGVVVVTSSENKAAEDSSVVVVEKITGSKDENGDAIDKLYGYQNGERVTLTAEKGMFKKNTQSLEKGDIIQVKADSKGNVKAVSVLFDIDASETEFSKDISENLTIEYGKVVKKFTNSFNLQVEGGSAKNYSVGDAKIHVVDTEKSNNSISVGDASDIQKFDDAKPERVFVRIYKDEVKDIVIIK